MWLKTSPRMEMMARVKKKKMMLLKALSDWSVESVQIKDVDSLEPETKLWVVRSVKKETWSSIPLQRNTSS